MRTSTPYSFWNQRLPISSERSGRFAVGHVQVGLDPHAADDLPAAFLDAPLDLVVHLRIFLGDPLRCTARRIACRCSLGYSFINCSAVEKVRFTTSTVSVHGPEPGGVDMRVAGEVQRRLLQQRA